MHGKLTKLNKIESFVWRYMALVTSIIQNITHEEGTFKTESKSPLEYDNTARKKVNRSRQGSSKAYISIEICYQFLIGRHSLNVLKQFISFLV